jgi:hypothetical protein
MRICMRVSTKMRSSLASSGSAAKYCSLRPRIETMWLLATSCMTMETAHTCPCVLMAGRCTCFVTMQATPHNMAVEIASTSQPMVCTGSIGRSIDGLRRIQLSGLRVAG